MPGKGHRWRDQGAGSSGILCWCGSPATAAIVASAIDFWSRRWAAPRIVSGRAWAGPKKVQDR